LIVGILLAGLYILLDPHYRTWGVLIIAFNATLGYPGEGPPHNKRTAKRPDNASAKTQLSRSALLRQMDGRWSSPPRFANFAEAQEAARQRAERKKRAEDEALARELEDRMDAMDDEEAAVAAEMELKPDVRGQLRTTGDEATGEAGHIPQDVPGVIRVLGKAEDSYVEREVSETGRQVPSGRVASSHFERGEGAVDMAEGSPMPPPPP